MFRVVQTHCFNFFGALVVVALLFGKEIIYSEGQYGTDTRG
jgi:hypothetical protein